MRIQVRITYNDINVIHIYKEQTSCNFTIIIIQKVTHLVRVIVDDERSYKKLPIHRETRRLLNAECEEMIFSSSSRSCNQFIYRY